MRLLIIAALLLAVSPAWAEWVQVDRSEKFATYIDPSTIKKDGHLRRVWALVELSTPDSSEGRSRKHFMEYDCKEERVRVLQAIASRGPMGDGEVTGNTSRPSEWSHIAPGMPAERMHSSSSPPDEPRL